MTPVSDAEGLTGLFFPHHSRAIGDPSRTTEELMSATAASSPPPHDGAAARSDPATDGNGVVIGPDGLARPAWASSDPLLSSKDRKSVV